MVAALKLLPVGRGHEGYGNAVSPPVPVRPRPRQDQEVLRLGFGVLAPRVELWKSVGRHAAASLGLGVRHDGDGLLVVGIGVREALGPLCKD